MHNNRNGMRPLRPDRSKLILETMVEGNEEEGMDGPPSDKTLQPPKFIIGASDEDFDEPNVEYEPEISAVVPPDGGWGWVVVGASFMCNLVVDGIIFTSGMLYPKLMEEFEISNSQVAWISSLLGGFYLLVGPFVSALANEYGFRTVCILGAFISSAACGISFFAPNIYFLYISFGIFGGMGFGLIYVPAVIATGFYFEKRRALATGIAVCGSGIGNFVIAPLNTYLLKNSTWRWNMVAYSGLALSCAVYGLAFRPLSASTGKRRRRSEDDDDFHQPGTPLLMRIKKARDAQLRQCASALSMASYYSRSASKVTLEEQTQSPKGQTDKVSNGNVSVAKIMLERHAVGNNISSSKRYSFPGLPNSEPIIEESETPLVDGVERIAGNVKEKEMLKNNENEKESIKNNEDEKNDSTKVLDNNKNETVLTKLQVLGSTTVPSNMYPRIESAPALVNLNIMSLEHNRRPSKISLRAETSRPFYRDDIFYSGSLHHLHQYKSSETVEGYHESVTHLPPPLDPLFEENEEGSQRQTGCCPTAISHVLERMFDFSLLTSVTFIVLGVSGSMALLALFVPFNFLPSFCKDVGINADDTSFLISLIGICNTVGRIVCGFISDHPKVDALVVNNVSLMIGGAATVVLPLLSDLSLLYAYAVFFGISVAAFASLRSILLVELLGLEKLTNAFGLLLLFQGVAATFGSPIAGAFVDATGNFRISFHIFGGIFCLSGLMCAPLRKVKLWEDNRRIQKEIERKNKLNI